jgi:predicted nuclease of predicted toxin-antitoxin system
VKLLRDLHISPRTVSFLRSLGHDEVRVDEVMLANSSDPEIIARAIQERVSSRRIWTSRHSSRLRERRPPR